jgi:hypothetical protein
VLQNGQLRSFDTGLRPLGLENVRCQADAGFAEVPVHADWVGEEQTVWVEVQIDIGGVFLHQANQRSPFDGGTKLHHIVFEHPPLSRLEPVIMRVQQNVERFVVHIEPSRHHVVQAEDYGCVGRVALQGSRHHAGFRKIVDRAARVGDELQGLPRPRDALFVPRHDASPWCDRA